MQLNRLVLIGDGRRHGETFVHSEIYKARPDVTSVLHEPPPYSIAFSAS